MLIYVLWVCVIVSALLLFMSQRGRQMLRYEAAIESRMALVKEMASLRQILYNQLLKGKLGTPYQNLVGNCTINITDANHLLNLNAATFDEIYELCISLKINDHIAEIISDSILDWVDADMLVRPNGAENSYYQNLTPSYNCKDKSIETLFELLLIRGIDNTILGLIKDFISFSGTGINFQFAPFEVLCAYTGDSETADQIIEYRKESALDDESLQMFLGFNRYEAISQRITLSSSDFYRLTITGDYKGIKEKFSRWIKVKN